MINTRLRFHILGLGLTVDERDGEPVLLVDVFQGREAAELHEMLSAWAEQVKKLKTEEISLEQYNSRRYHYPKYGTTQRLAKVSSQGLSDILVDVPKKPIWLNQNKAR